MNKGRNKYEEGTLLRSVSEYFLNGRGGKGRAELGNFYFFRYDNFMFPWFIKVLLKLYPRP